MMASSSSSGSRCKYDVFISFRGEDTRKIFVGHLYRALQQKAINTFIDSEGLSKGNKISELLTSIEDSRLSIVVLSQNYASSTWCLKELVKILDCMDTKKQIVVPIFYEVDPSHPRKINGKFAEAFAKHGENPNLDKEELKSWRFALTRVADLSGWDSRKYEDDGKLIEEIVENTRKELIHTSSSKANGLVGMDSHITEMNSRLCLQVNDVRVVGIWGMGGLGKTTIARAVFDEIACQFEHSCFLDNVKEAFINKRQVQMQEELISILLEEKVQSLGLNRGWNMIKERLGMKKVLVVLDDVETFAQIEALLGEPHAFGEGSRLIVTTRNKQSLSGVNETYKPSYLRDDEALELFRKYAFRTNQPNRDYDHLSRLAIEYAQGLPLALKVLGAFLDNKSVCEWVVVLEKLKQIPHIEIQDVLRTSFEGLDESEKDIFLDIACLFREWDKDFVTQLLDSFGFFPNNGLRVLVDRALITISEDDELSMHDLLQDMGREIVRQECIIEPGKRSRLWSYGDIYGVLTQNTGTNAVQCLMLDLSSSKDDLSIDIGAFVRMTKLRLLIIYYSFYNIFYGEDICPVDGCKQLSRGDLEFLSHELRFLLWHGCPLKSLPSTFIPKNLVHLDMRGSHIQKLWEEKKPLQNLKVIMLSHCRYLVNVPDFTEAINLQKLFLDGCSSLFEVHSSVFALQNLHFLDLKGCKQLKILPSCIHMESLWYLCLSGCSNLEKFPEIADVMTELKELYLDGTAIKELPSSINNLTGLKELNLEGCTELKTLSTSIHMSSLRTLNLNGCSNLEKFPEISGIMKVLFLLLLDGTAIKELPSSIDLLEGIKKLSMRNCKILEFLPDSICNLARLTHLDLYGCSVLHNLPDKLGHLESLQVLDVRYSGIKQLPYSILHLEKLRGDELSCIGCKEMTAPLSAWPSSMEEYCSYSVLLHLDLSDCNLSELSDGIAHLYSLRTLKLCRNNLESLPVTMNQLGWLSHLELEACKRLKSIPELSSSINYIDAHDCMALEIVSKPKLQYQTNHFFTFSNCFQLVQTNLFIDIVERHSHLQDIYLRPLRLKMSLPGSEVPKWFNHQTSGFSVSVQLPLNWCDSNFLGFAICAVCKCQGINDDTSPLSASCLCTFKGNRGECSFSFDLLNSVFRTDRLFSSDHMFLRYVSWFDCRLIEEGKLVNEAYTEATFQILVVTESITEQLRIRSCGVRFIYANPDEMLDLNMPPPQVHVDSCETGVCFLDPYELRNKQTERVEILTEIESSETAEGRDTCHTLQLFPEQQIERKAEKDIMEMTEPEEGEEVESLYSGGSSVIVTTRNKQLLCGVNETYKPAFLSNGEALELFMKYAFRTNQPNGDYDHLSRRAIKYAQGLPLALKVMGAFLDNKSVCEWEAVLEKLKKIPHIEIQDVLKTSFDGLNDSEKDIFLDIACLFKEFGKDFVTKLQDSCGFIPLNDLRVLIDRALITITEEDNSLDMHDLLQEMGREIVRQKSTIEPGNRSRLWGFEDVNHIMTQNTATDAVECLMLDFLDKEVELCINTEALVKMTKLRVLIIYCPPERRCCQQLTIGDLKFLSHELRLLLWHGCPLKSLPSAFIPKNLVKLDMRESDIQQLWEGIKPLQNLKVIMLSHCQYLVKIPDLTKAINLEKLFLDGCSSLFEVHSSVFALQNLHLLNLNGCKKIKILPSSIHMKSLKTFNLSGCSNVDKFPEISDVMTELNWLYLGGTAIKELPSSINKLTRLRALNLKGCTKLKTLSSSIHMSSLSILDLDGCSNLEKFPEISGIMKELPFLCLDGTAIKGLPSSIDLLLGIKKLSMRNCKSLEYLPGSICKLAELKHLYLSGCSVLHNLPEKLGDLESLQVLDASYSGIKQIPFSILRLSNRLLCVGCQEMTAPLSAWPPSMEEYCSYSVLLHLDLSDCRLLELSDGIAHLSSLKTLKLCRNNLESLPVTMNQLSCLTHLELEACKRLKSIPELSSSINYILADDCTALETVLKPKPRHRSNHIFTFCNCLQLVQTNLFRDIVETHSHFQDNYLRPLVLKMSLPGSEVPDWYTHRSRGFSVSVNLPENWLDHRFLGFAFCTIRKYQGVDHYTPHLSAACLWTFKGRSGECSFSIGLYDTVLFGNNRVLRSDHMFQGYVSWPECHSIAQGKLLNETYTEATFKILVESVYMKEEHSITSCGVRFVYANQDEMLNPSIAQPQVHVDSCGTGVSSMDTYEMRKEETERVEITEISMEVESLESGEGRDTSHILQLLLEQPKERKEEKDTMEMTEHEEGCPEGVSSTVCCCLSWMVALCHRKE